MPSRELMYGRKYQTGLNRITTAAMIAFHAGAMAAFFFIDYGAILTAVVLYVVAGMFGIGMCYHRLLTHRAYKTHKSIEYVLTWCATLALEGGPIFWVATHRIHHQNSDHEGDPHTPREGTWWAHMGWILSGAGMHHDRSVLARYVPDLVRDRVRRALQLALDVEPRRGSRVDGVRRHPLRALGHLPPHDRRPARHVARQLGDAQMGIAPVRHAR
jgi:stearoyl-CoA desaturase (delta-9 desaturase)